MGSAFTPRLGHPLPQSLAEYLYSIYGNVRGAHALVLGGPIQTRQKVHSVRISGTVKFFNGAKGFGFIAPEDGSKDVFVHATALEAAGIQSLNEGDRVSFVLEDDRKGRGKQAGQVQKG